MVYMVYKETYSLSYSVTSDHQIRLNVQRFQAHKEVQASYLSYAYAYSIRDLSKMGEWAIKNWFQIGKGAQQGCILSPCLFNICRIHHVKGWTGGIPNQK